MLHRCITWLYRSTVITSVSARAITGNPANVVSAQVDEHNMFGPFLRIGEQFLRQPLIFFFGFASRRMPARGRMVTRSPSTRTMISGELPTRHSGPDFT